MPDRKRGFTKRDNTILPPDPNMADRYRRNMKDDPVKFDEGIQKAMIDEIMVASRFQRFVPRGLGTDDSHIHALVTWTDKRVWSQLRDGIRYSITKRLNKQFGRRRWLVESASRKRVRNRDHYDYLTKTYIPDHPGWKWSPDKQLYL